MPDPQTGSIAPLVVTPDEAYPLLRIKRSKFFELLRTGEIASIKIGRCRRIEVDELAAYVARQRGQASSQDRAAL